MGAEYSTSSHDCFLSTQVQIDFPKSRLKNKVVHEKRLCGKPLTNASSSSLIQLILNEEWQRTLIRIITNPRDVSVFQRCKVSGVWYKVLPLHLVCAMNPPVEVVKEMINTDNTMSAAGTPMQTVSAKNRTPSGNIKTMTNKENRASPTEGQDTKDRKVKGRDKIIDSVVSKMPLALLVRQRTRPIVFSQMNSDVLPEKEEDFIPTDISTVPSHDEDKDEQIALQLTPTGGVSEMDISIQTTDTSSFSFAEVFDDSSPAHPVVGKTPMTLSSDFADDVLPLHIACLFRSSPEVIESLIKAYPGGVRQKNKCGMLPLHVVCSGIVATPATKSLASSSNLSHDFLKSLTKIRGAAKSVTEKDWKLDVVVSLLVSAFPESVSIRSSNAHSASPIEYAEVNLPEGSMKEAVMFILCNRKASHEQILPENVCLQPRNVLWETKKSPRGRAVSNTKLLSSILKQDWPAVRQQVIECPEEASVWAIEQNIHPTVPYLPIHAAFVAQAPGGVITDLISAYPEGLKEAAKNEALPLHLACQYKASLESIQALLRSYPEAASIRDAAGFLPIHVACMDDACPEVIEELIEAYPQGRDVKDYNGHTALTYIEALSSHPNREAIVMMLECPNEIRSQNT